jgi:prevent-host-death family protein
MADRNVAMTELSLEEAHERFLEVVDRAEEAKERIYLTRSGKRIAAIVPIEDVEAIEKIEDRIDRRALKRARGNGSQRDYLTRGDEGEVRPVGV